MFNVCSISCNNFTDNDRFPASAAKDKTISMQTDQITLFNYEGNSHRKPSKKKKGFCGRFCHFNLIEAIKD